MNSMTYFTITIHSAKQPFNSACINRNDSSLDYDT